MKQTVVGVFERDAAARRAAAALVAHGIVVTQVEPEVPDELLAAGAATAGSAAMAAPSGGAGFVTVEVDEGPDLELAREMLQDNGAVAIEERATDCDFEARLH